MVRFNPETYARARALYPAPPEVEVKPDDVIGYVLDLAEQQREQERAWTAVEDQGKEQVPHLLGVRDFVWLDRRQGLMQDWADYCAG